MSQPTPYSRQFDFTGHSSSKPSTPQPGVQIDAELNAIRAALNHALTNLSLIQRDDTALANGTVGIEQLNSVVQAMLAAGGFAVRGQWMPSTAYVRGDIVANDELIYLVIEDHNSSASLAADIASGYVTSAIFDPHALIEFQDELAATGGADLVGTSTANNTVQDILDSIRTALGITGAASTMGDFTTPVITDGSDTKEALEELGAAIEDANTALGTSPGDTSMGNFTTTFIPDGSDGKEAFEALGLAHGGLFDRVRLGTHLPFAPDFTNNTITVRDGSSDTYHRHFGGIAEGMDGRLHLIYRRAAAHAVTDGATIYYTYSDDGGQTWSAEAVLVAGVAGFDQRGMSICVTPTGRVLVIYDQVPVVSGTTTFRLIYSDDNGETWTQGTNITSVPFTFARAYGRIKLIGSHVSNSYRLCWTPYYQTSATPTYKVAAWYSSDDGLTWTEGTALDTTGYNEAEMVAINDQTWFAVIRGSGLNFLKTTNGGTSWTDLGQITTSDGVAPSLDKFYYNGRWYLLLGYCDRSLDTQAFKIAPVEDALTTPAAFGAPLVVATDAVNASGYQSTVTKPDGTVYIDEGVGFVWFKEYIGFDYSQVRFGRANLFKLARESGRGVAVASDAFTVYSTEFEPKLIITTEGGAGTDNLATINGGYEGQIIRCESATSSLDVTFKHGTGNLVLQNGRDFTLFTAGATASHIALMKMGDNWYEIARSVDSTNGFYSVGSWVPAPRGSGTAGTPTGTFAGEYTKIGRRVEYSCQLVFTAITGMVGNVEVANLPFTVTNSASARHGIEVGFRSNFTNDFVIGGYTVENSTFIRLQRMDQDGVAVAVGDLSATTNLYFSGHYLAAT